MQQIQEKKKKTYLKEIMINEYAITCSRRILDYVDDFSIFEAKANSASTIFVNCDGSFKRPIAQTQTK